jgi:hypothetical protein
MASHSSTAPAGSRSWQAPVWLPWITAPLFFLLPIGGCGIASVRRPAIDVAGAAEPLLPGPVAPAATMVTVATAAR